MICMFSLGQLWLERNAICDSSGMKIHSYIISLSYRIVTVFVSPLVTQTVCHHFHLVLLFFNQ